LHIVQLGVHSQFLFCAFVFLDSIPTDEHATAAAPDAEPDAEPLEVAAR
jgi:hypothetical protein